MIKITNKEKNIFPLKFNKKELIQLIDINIKKLYRNEEKNNSILSKDTFMIFYDLKNNHFSLSNNYKKNKHITFKENPIYRFFIPYINKNDSINKKEFNSYINNIICYIKEKLPDQYYQNILNLRQEEKMTLALQHINFDCLDFSISDWKRYLLNCDDITNKSDIKFLTNQGIDLGINKLSVIPDISVFKSYSDKRSLKDNMYNVYQYKNTHKYLMVNKNINLTEIKKGTHSNNSMKLVLNFSFMSLLYILLGVTIFNAINTTIYYGIISLSIMTVISVLQYILYSSITVKINKKYSKNNNMIYLILENILLKVFSILKFIGVFQIYIPKEYDYKSYAQLLLKNNMSLNENYYHLI